MSAVLCSMSCCALSSGRWKVLHLEHQPPLFIPLELSNQLIAVRSIDNFWRRRRWMLLFAAAAAAATELLFAAAAAAAVFYSRG